MNALYILLCIINEINLGCLLKNLKKTVPTYNFENLEGQNGPPIRGAINFDPVKCEGDLFTWIESVSKLILNT